MYLQGMSFPPKALGEKWLKRITLLAMHGGGHSYNSSWFVIAKCTWPLCLTLQKLVSGLKSPTLKMILSLPSGRLENWSKYY